MNGLNKRIHLLIILLVGAVGTAFLVTRPKSVVKDEAQTVQKNPKPETQKELGRKLTEEGQKQVSALNQELKSKNNDIAVLEKIADVYLRESIFDSAAYFAEKVAVIKPSVVNWTNTADLYFQAYNLALNPENVERLVEKTRDGYNKVIALEPLNLHAKTNLAMTYVGSDAPMKAIGMLREVLDQEPNYIPAIMSLGGLSMQSTQYDKAAARFLHVIKIRRSNVNAKLGLAYSFIELNKKEEAKILLKEVLNQKIDPTMKDEITKTLNSLK